MKTATLSLTARYDERVTDAEALCSALDRLLETAMGTPGILEEYGDPGVSEFQVFME